MWYLERPFLQVIVDGAITVALAAAAPISWSYHIMAVDRSDIAKLANLARIAISDDAADEVANRISTVLALVDQLQAVNTDGVLPMAHPLDAVQRLRADVVTEPNQRELFQSIAPATQDGLYLVPQVIE